MKYENAFCFSLPPINLTLGPRPSTS